MTTIYRADNLGQIAAHFESMAASAFKAAQKATTVSECKLKDREAVIWNQAAEILRQTTLPAS